MDRSAVTFCIQKVLWHFAARVRPLGFVCSLLLVTAAAAPNFAQAHDIPSRITVNAFVKPAGDTLTVLLRVPMEAFGEISFPLRGPGFIQISEADFAINDAARVYLTESFKFYENGVELTEKSVAAVRVELPSDRSFTDYDSAVANVLSTPLEDSVNLYCGRGYST